MPPQQRRHREFPLTRWAYPVIDDRTCVLPTPPGERAGPELTTIDDDRALPSFGVTLADRQCLVEIHGELDMASAPQLTQMASTLLARGAADSVLDLSGLSFIDAAGLGAVVDLAQRLAAHGATLTVHGASKRARRIFAIGRLECLLTPE